MSAFVVSRRHINVILSGLVKVIESDSDSPWSAMQGTALAKRLDMRDRMAPRRLGQSMTGMNQLAVNRVYNESCKPERFQYSPAKNPAPSIIAWVKLLNCWLYQCSEGCLTRTKLYRQVADCTAVASCVGEKMTGSSLENSPFYFEAPWAI